MKMNDALMVVAGRVAVLTVLLVCGIAVQPSAIAQQPATIEAPVTTAFGVYTPLSAAQIRAESGLSEPTVSSGFSNVATPAGRFPWNNFFSQSERTLLERNNFVVRPEAFGTFGELYNKTSASQEVGSFITVDAVLHGLRVTVAESQRKLERDYMAPTIESLLGSLSRTLSGQLAGERDPRVAGALGRLLAYVETGRVLIEPSSDVNDRVREVVQSEVARIRAAGGVAQSSVFPSRRIDYAAFAPTGHYRLNDAFGNYFRARTWLSAVGLSLHDAGGDLDADEARMAALLAYAIEASSGDNRFVQRYQDVYELSAFFTGRSESDITWDMIAGSFGAYYGKMMGSVSSALSADSTVMGFARYAESQLPGASGARMLRLLPSTSSRGIVDRISDTRRAPSTVISSAIFSSVGAADARAASALRRELSSRLKEDWVQSMEWALLYTLQPLVAEPGESNGFPRFARNDAWRAMRTASALGAWADYQHPLNTPSIKSIRVAATNKIAASSDLGTSGYVEPTPEGWARVASLAGFLRSGLNNPSHGSILGRELDLRLRDIENTAARMMQIAAAELRGRELTGDQHDLIASMKSRIAAYETFTDRSLTNGSPIVAGISTERAAGSVGATGHPLAVYAIVPRNDGVGGLMLTRGAVYSYYEVESDPSAWLQSATSSGGDIAPASWMSSFLATDRTFSFDASKFQPIEATLTSATSYVPTKEEKKQRLFTVDLDLESNTVRSSAGELWYTVRAPELDGADIIVAVLNTGGREVYRTTPARIEAGKRYDMVRVDDLQPGQYFMRVTDHSDRTLASGRFLVVR